MGKSNKEHKMRIDEVNGQGMSKGGKGVPRSLVTWKLADNNAAAESTFMGNQGLVMVTLH